MSNARRMRTALGLCAAVMMGLMAQAAEDLPTSVFVVHCEPTNANPAMWASLVDLVALADRHEIPLSIDFTAQWAEMILADAAKVSALALWIDGGHEIACHHHAYWSTMGRAAQWDGYTNTATDEILPQDRSRYRGTMDEYLALLEALPGDRRSGCLGGSDDRDAADWPCSLIYSTVGHAVEDAVSSPTARSVGDCEVLEIGHALIVGAGRGALQALYEATAADAIFGVVGHVYNYAEMPAAFEQWFAFLAASDADGARRGTVSGVLDAWLAGHQ